MLGNGLTEFGDAEFFGWSLHARRFPAVVNSPRATAQRHDEQRRAQSEIPRDRQHVDT